MRDVELLELAAKVADIEVERDGDAVFFYNEFKDTWCPLIDDGDALRLAVRLKMDVTVGQSIKVVCATGDEYVSRVVLPLGDDPYVAVRRAIVTAAAEVAALHSDA